MNILRLFGMGSDAILAKNCYVNGTIIKVSRCWWLRVKTKPARLYASEENTLYPHIITFSYQVNSIPYTGRLYIPIRYRVPRKGETISVYCDPAKPKNMPVLPLGREQHTFSW